MNETGKWLKDKINLTLLLSVFGGTNTLILIPGICLIRFSEDSRFQIETVLIENQYSFKFKMASNQEASLKAWEEENAEYATWNLIDDEQDTASC